MYFDTTEKVIDRRLSLNSWNYGICLATLGAAGLLANWAVTTGGLRLVILAGIAVLAGMGCLLCVFWVGQLRDLKLLNNAKFSVLAQMAPQIKFNGGEKSYEPFAREWEILTHQGAITKKGRLRIPVLKSSGAEFLLPRVFMTIFGLIVLLIATLCIVNGSALTRKVFQIPSANEQAVEK